MPDDEAYGDGASNGEPPGDEPPAAEDGEECGDGSGAPTRDGLDRPSSEERPAGDETHVWIECPGCVPGSSIGVPHGYAADTVVCPRCRQIVRVREADRLLWRGRAASDSDDAGGRDAGVIQGWAESLAPSCTSFRNEDGLGRKSGGSFGGTGGAPEGKDRDAEPSADDRLDAWQRAAAGRRGRCGSAARASPTREHRALWREEEPRLRRWLFSGAAITPFVLSAVMFSMAFSTVPRPRARKTVARRPAEASPGGSWAAAHETPGNDGQRVNPAKSQAQPPKRQKATSRRRQKSTPRKAQPVKPSARTSRPSQTESAAAPMPKPSRPVMLYRRAIGRLKTKNYAGALDDLDELLLTSPGMGRAGYYHAEALAGLGRVAEALGELNAAIRATPGDPWPWRARGLLRARLCHWLRAAVDLRQAIAIERKRMDGLDDSFAIKVADKLVGVVDQLDRHANELIKQQRFAAALDELTEVLRHQPDSASARLRRAVVYTQLHNDDRALEDFDVALSLRRGPAQAFGARAGVHERHRDYVAALADLDVAIELAPERADYRERQRRLKNRLSAERWRSVPVRPATWKMP